MQPRVRSVRKRLTRRSSSEWNEIAARRPPTRSTSHASGSAASSWASSSLTAIRMAWKLRFAGMAAGEPRGRRDRGGDRVDELERGGQRPAADDLPGDPVRVALLAVLAQHAREPAAVPRVDELGGGQLLLGVHPHVERGVVGVREAALARVDLHRGHAEVEVGDVGAHALLGELPQAVLEVGADEAGVARHLGRELGERLLSERVAVDRDQRAGRPEAVGDEPGVAGGAERAVDRDLPGRGSRASISSPARTGTCVRGMSSRMAKRCGEVRRPLGQVAVVGLPGRAVPELEAVAGAGDDDLAVDRRVLELARGQHHAAGRVQLRVRRVAAEHPLELARLAENGFRRDSAASVSPVYVAAGYSEMQGSTPRTRNTFPDNADRNRDGTVSRFLESSECSKVPWKAKAHVQPVRSGFSRSGVAGWRSPATPDSCPPRASIRPTGPLNHLSPPCRSNG